MKKEIEIKIKLVYRENINDRRLIEYFAEKYNKQYIDRKKKGSSIKLLP